MTTRDVLMAAGGAAAGAAGSAIAYEAWRRQAERTVLDGKPARVTRVDARNLTADADTFQFKSGGDAAGVTDRLRGVRQWNAAAAGKVMVYEYANGRQVIADGHQRLGLATRLMGEGHAPIKMDAVVLRQADGWSPSDVKAYAAIKNMHESSGQSLDMAKVMRERPDLVTSSLPLSDGKVREARALSHLSEPAFRSVVGGVVKPEVAAAIGDAVKDTGRHADLLAEMQRANVESAQHARLYVSQAMAAPTYTSTTGSLFGDETEVRSLLKERVAVLDKAMTALKQDKRIFGLLEREADSIEGAGNKLAHETNAARAEGAGRTAALVEKLAGTRGPVSSMLDEAAKAVASGESPARAARTFLRDVGDRMQAGGIQTLSSDAPAGWQPEARAAAAKNRPAKAARKPRAREAAYIERPPQSKGKATPEANAKWGRILDKLPVSAAEQKRLERKRQASLSKGASEHPRRVQEMVERKPPGQSSFLPEATTGEKISAKSKALAAKGRVGDPMTEGLFSSAKDQTDLVEAAKRQPKTDAQIADEARAIAEGRTKGASPERLAQLDRRADALNRAAIGRAMRGDEAGMQKAEALGKLVDEQRLPTQVANKINPGWSDAAREASAEARASNAGTPEMTKPSLSDMESRISKLKGDALKRVAEEMGVRAGRTDKATRNAIMRKAGTSVYNAESIALAKVATPVGQSGPADAGAGSRALADQSAKLSAAIEKVAAKPWAVIDSDTGQVVYDNMATGKEARKWASTHNADEFDGTGRRNRYRVQRAVPTNQQAAVDKITAEIREMFSRSPDGKQKAMEGRMIDNGKKPRPAPRALKPSADSQIAAIDAMLRDSAERAAPMADRVKKLSGTQLNAIVRDLGLPKSGTRAQREARLAKYMADATEIDRRAFDHYAENPKEAKARISKLNKGLGSEKASPAKAATPRWSTAMSARPGKGPAGWSDAAREASAKKRAANAKPNANAEAVRTLTSKAMGAKRNPNATPADVYKAKFGYAPPKGMPADAIKRWTEGSLKVGPSNTGDPAYEKVVARIQDEALKSQRAMRETDNAPAPKRGKPRTQEFGERPARTVQSGKSKADVSALADTFKRGMSGGPESQQAAAAAIKAANLSKADAHALALATGSAPRGKIAVSTSKANAIKLVTNRLDALATSARRSMATAGRIAGSLGPVGIVGAAAVAFDATRNSAKAAGAGEVASTASGVAAAGVAGGAAWGVGAGISKGIGALTKIAPTIGGVAAKAVPMAMAAGAAYSTIKGAYEGYQTGGVTGAVKGGAVGLADFATFGAVSHFTSQGPSSGPVRLSSEQAAQFQEANARYAEMKKAEVASTGSNGWSDAARIGAYKARMERAGKPAANLPYNGASRTATATAADPAAAMQKVRP